jgi:hypothetical protein
MLTNEDLTALWLHRYLAQTYITTILIVFRWISDNKHVLSRDCNWTVTCQYVMLKCLFFKLLSGKQNCQLTVKTKRVVIVINTKTFKTTGRIQSFVTLPTASNVTVHCTFGAQNSAKTLYNGFIHLTLRNILIQGIKLLYSYNKSYWICILSMGSASQLVADICPFEIQLNVADYHLSFFLFFIE